MDLTRRAPFTLTLSEPFVISRSADSEAEVVQVAIVHDGVVGYGEGGARRPHYGESVPRRARRSASRRRPLLGDDPFAHGGDARPRSARCPARWPPSARSTAALHDLVGKLCGQPLWRILGLDPETIPPTSYTISIDTVEGTADRARRAAGYHALKIKVGGPDDLERVRVVRGEAPDALIRVDANEAWTVEFTRDICPELVALNVELIEQPLHADRPRRLRRAARGCGCRSRSCSTRAATRCPTSRAAAGRADGVNIKLTKSGGIREALRMIHAARALGLRMMLGCMNESSLGIAPAAADLAAGRHRRSRRPPAERQRRLRRGSASSDGCGAAQRRARPGRRAAGAMAVKRYVILAEGGFAEHDAKTADRRAALRAPIRPVAVIDSTRAGSTRPRPRARASTSTCRSSRSLDEAMALRRRHAADRHRTRRREAARSLADDDPARRSSAGWTSRAASTTSLGDDPELAAAAAMRAGVEIRDLRRAPAGLDVPTGANLDRRRARRCATVGTDCALGKMTVCLELDREARRRGLASVFVPTGQTGIAIAGWGIAVDEVVSDFVAGAVGAAGRRGRRARRRRGAAVDRGPGLDQPSALLRRHAGAAARLGAARDGARPRAGPRRTSTCPTARRSPPLPQLIEDYERIAGVRAARRRWSAVALKTNRLDEAAARAAVDRGDRAETGLPADDPVRFGAGGSARRGAGRARTVTFRRPWPTPDSTRWPRCCAGTRSRSSRATWCWSTARPARPACWSALTRELTRLGAHADGAAAAGQRRAAAAGGGLGRAAGVRLDDRRARDRCAPTGCLTIWAESNTRGDERGARRPPGASGGGRRGRWSSASSSARRAGESRWCGVTLPTAAQAQEAGMALADYEEFVYGAGHLDDPDPIAAWREVSAPPGRGRASGSRRCGSCGSSPRTPT